MWQAPFPSLAYVFIPYKSPMPGYKDMPELLKHCRQLKAITTKYDCHSANRVEQNVKPIIVVPHGHTPGFYYVIYFKILVSLPISLHPQLLHPSPHISHPAQCNKHILFQTSTVYSSFYFEKSYPQPIKVLGSSSSVHSREY